MVRSGYDTLSIGTHPKISVIIYYDYILTLKDEVRFFWGRGFGLVPVLFFLNKYISLFGTIPNIVLALTNESDKVSRGAIVYHIHRKLIAIAEVKHVYSLISTLVLNNNNLRFHEAAWGYRHIMHIS